MCFELLGIDVPRKGSDVTIHGFYDFAHLVELTSVARQLSDDGAKQVVFSINPLTIDVHHRRPNQVGVLTDQSLLGTDRDVVVRSTVLIELRPSVDADGLPSHEGRTAVSQTAEKIRTGLVRLGIGNVYCADCLLYSHTHLPVNLPANDHGWIRGVLHDLANHFDTQHVKVNRSLHRPRLLVPLYDLPLFHEFVIER
jgi:hypothetical protein